MAAFGEALLCLLFWTGDMDYNFVLNINLRNFAVTEQKYFKIINIKKTCTHHLHSCIIRNPSSLYISWNVLRWQKLSCKYAYIVVFAVAFNRSQCEYTTLLYKLHIWFFFHNHWYLTFRYTNHIAFYYSPEPLVRASFVI